MGFNLLLDAELASLRTLLPDVTLVGLDIFTLGKDVAADPDAFSLTNVADGALLLGDIVNANDYVYWDEVHPTGAMHGLIAERAALALGIPEPSAVMFLVLGVSGILFQRRRLG